MKTVDELFKELQPKAKTPQDLIIDLQQDKLDKIKKLISEEVFHPPTLINEIREILK